MQDFLFYFQLGWEHIITDFALDHLLFILILGVVFSLKDYKKLMVLITAFTIGHSITLIFSTLNLLQINSKLVEFLIPCTIAITAISNFVLVDKPKKEIIYQYIFALFFGLIHGLGFANTLKIMISNEQDLFLPLLGFNVGIEFAQIMVIFFILLILELIIKFTSITKKSVVLFVSTFVLIIAIYMMWMRFYF
ncbi:HupE/UreJ family protein [Frigoriflavimonas asaccharolytica]|uniref:HupE / UreJ protein n=1 Tax=Frigoriflavimonas asaccharolytica TaxID=2735899 RepID=A0A8J8GDE2_9FLAO|nr:HupE/UreJ family protein [Frigoriflavimonas asaccharolytica]NRS93727.1 hypothetical protein [Frigoriflavimonas asaccharolytica]